MDDTDLGGMGAADARAYALEFMTALKALDRQLASLGDELATWARRVELAAAKGAADLEAAARAKVDELAAMRSTLEAERSELAYKVSRIREKLPMAAAGERSVDADLLLSELRMAAGLSPDDRDDVPAPATPASQHAGASGPAAGPGSPAGTGPIQPDRPGLAKDLDSLGVDDELAKLKKKMGL